MSAGRYTVGAFAILFSPDFKLYKNWKQDAADTVMFLRILTTELKWTIVEWAMIDISAVANIEIQFAVATCVIMV